MICRHHTEWTQSKLHIAGTITNPRRLKGYKLMYSHCDRQNRAFKHKKHGTSYSSRLMLCVSAHVLVHVLVHMSSVWPRHSYLKGEILCCTVSVRFIQTATRAHTPSLSLCTSNRTISNPKKFSDELSTRWSHNITCIFNYSLQNSEIMQSDRKRKYVVFINF